MAPPSGYSRRSPSDGCGVAGRPSGSAFRCAGIEGPNPFGAGSREFLKQQRPSSAQRPVRSSSVQRRGPAPHGMQKVSEVEVQEALQKLDGRDTLQAGASQLARCMGRLEGPDDFAWFLRTAFDERRPLGSVKARREQLLVLASASDSARYPRLHSALLEQPALRDRVFQTLVAALRQPDSEDVVARACCELLDGLSPDTAADSAEGAASLRAASSAALRALLDPLVLGSGWELPLRRQCLVALGAVTRVLLEKAGSSDDCQEMLERLATRLLQCLDANPGLHEGLLQCLAQLIDRCPLSVSHRARPLVELCTGHLLLTPSATPAYAPRRSAAEIGRSESPKRGSLTRNFALVCCVCLKSLAEAWQGVSDDDGSDSERRQAWLHEHLPALDAALDRNDLNLQRLTTANEPLRHAINHAWSAWHQIANDGADAAYDSDDEARNTWQRDVAFSNDAQLRQLARPLSGDPAGGKRPWQRCMSPGSKRRGSHERGCEHAGGGGAQAARSLGRPTSTPGRPRAGARGSRPTQRQHTDVPPRPVAPGAAAGPRARDGDDSLDRHPELAGGRPSSLARRAAADPADPVHDFEGRTLRPGELADYGALESHPDRRTDKREEWADGPHAAAERREELESKPRPQSEQRVFLADAASPDERQRTSGKGIHDCESFDIHPAGVDDDPESSSNSEAGQSPKPALVRHGRSATCDDMAQYNGTRDDWNARSVGVNTAQRRSVGASAGTSCKDSAPERHDRARDLLGTAANTQKNESTSTQNGAGRLPPARKDRAGTVAHTQTEDVLGPVTQPVNFAVPPDHDAPYLSQALRCIADGRLDDAFSLVFQLGNEKSLRGVLKGLHATTTWPRLSGVLSQHLARVLVMLMCKAPRSVPSQEACAWLHALVTRCPGARSVLDESYLPSLQGALFDLSGTTGESAVLASGIYYELFHGRSHSGRATGPGTN